MIHLSLSLMLKVLFRKINVFFFKDFLSIYLDSFIGPVPHDKKCVFIPISE